MAVDPHIANVATRAPTHPVLNVDRDPMHFGNGRVRATNRKQQHQTESPNERHCLFWNFSKSFPAICRLAGGFCGKFH